MKLSLPMKTTSPRTLLFTGIVALFLSFCTKNSRATETNVYGWNTRPQLTSDQQRMLQLQQAAEMGRDGSPLRAQNKAELVAMEQKLGSLSVRAAKPGELLLFPIRTNVCGLYNPTHEGLVLTVSIVDDIEQMGTRMASMGRQAYFPPGSTIIVTNLYWTTPGTSKKPMK